MAPNIEKGESVYCSQSVEQRSTAGLYRAVRKYLIDSAPAGTVIDLGCSDLPYADGLNRNILGLDLAGPALIAASRNGFRGKIAQVDLEKVLPINDRLSKIHTVLILDVLEHLKNPVALLKSVQNQIAGRPLEFLVSMPVISPRSIRTWIEATQVIRHGHRPETGLYDRTHILLTDSKGHKKIFSEAGLEIVDQASVGWFGVDGSSKLSIPPVATGIRSTILRQLTEKALPHIVHPGNTEKRQNFMHQLNEYQRLYILQPK